MRLGAACSGDIRTGGFVTFAKARAILKRGKNVRRALWDSSIRMDGGVLVWNISEALARECSASGNNANRTYKMTKTDEASTDWVQA